MGGSSSKSSSSQTTNNTDNRIVTESGVVASGGSSIVATIEHLDGDIVKDALQFATDASDDNSASLDKLIGLASDLFGQGADLIRGGQDTVLAAAQSVANDQRGAIDQKTIVVLGLGAAAVAAIALTKGKN